MSVPDQRPSTEHVGNAVTTVFPYNFLLFNADDLKVMLSGALLSFGVHYSVSGLEVETGGNVTFVTAPAAGAQITIYRSVVVKRDTNYQYQGDFQSPTVNRDFDRTVQMIQDATLSVEGALRFPPGDLSSAFLPDSSTRALKTISFDETGRLKLVNSTGDAFGLAVNLASNAGPGMLGYDNSKTYAPGTVGALLNVLPLHADSYGLTGDDAPGVLQAFLDICEARNLCATFNAKKTYKIKQTLYLGNLQMQTNGALFDIVSDAGFIQAGAAPRKSESAIVMKSAVDAGYGLATVSITADILRYRFSRPVNLVGPKTALLLEQIDGLYIPILDAKTVDGQNTAKCLIDFYGNIKNARIDIVNYYARNGLSAEGFWIRNAFPGSLENVHIGQIFLNHEGFDEGLAIYTFNLGSPSPLLRNVTIGSISARCTYGNGISLIDISGSAYNQVRFANIGIGKIYLEWYPGRLNGFGVKTEGLPADIDSVNVVIQNMELAGGNNFAVRAIAAAGQIDRTRIGKVIINLWSMPNIGAVYGIYGPLDVGAAYTSTAAGIKFTEVVSNGASVEEGVIAGESTGPQISNALYFGQKVKVYGRMQGVVKFFGTIYANTDQWNNNIWFLHTATTNAPEVGTEIDAKVVISGGGTIMRIVNTSGALANEKTVDIKLRIENLSDKALPADVVSGSWKLTAYDVVQVKSTGAVRITLPLSV